MNEEILNRWNFYLLVEKKKMYVASEMHTIIFTLRGEF